MILVYSQLISIKKSIPKVLEKKLYFFANDISLLSLNSKIYINTNKNTILLVFLADGKNLSLVRYFKNFSPFGNG